MTAYTTITFKTEKKLKDAAKRMAQRLATRFRRRDVHVQVTFDLPLPDVLRKTLRPKRAFKLMLIRGILRRTDNGGAFGSLNNHG